MKLLANYAKTAYEEEKKITEYTVNPWTRAVWTVRVHLHPGFFSVSTIVLHNPRLVESTYKEPWIGENHTYGGPITKLNSGFVLWGVGDGGLAPLLPPHPTVQESIV